MTNNGSSSESFVGIGWDCSRVESSVIEIKLPPCVDQPKEDSFSTRHYIGELFAQTVSDKNGWCWSAVIVDN